MALYALPTPDGSVALHNFAYPKYNNLFREIQTRGQCKFLLKVVTGKR